MNAEKMKTTGATAGLRCQGLPPYDWIPVDLDGKVEDSSDENMGSKRKFWFEDGNEKWLFKYSRDKNQHVSGEDWAECLVHVIAQLFGVPSACTSLATCNGRRGVAVKTLLRPREELVHGNELLTASIEGYDKEAGTNNPQYSVRNIKKALEGYQAPAPYSRFAAFDWLAGYLMMDALVAGGDRHHENWGVIKHGARDGQLAPSFDHGNALGFAEPFQKVESLIESCKDLNGWLRKGRSKHFSANPTLVEVAVEAYRLASAEGKDFFMARLHDLPLSELQTAAEAIPEEILSAAHSRFAMQIVCRNRRRLCDAIGVG